MNNTENIITLFRRIRCVVFEAQDYTSFPRSASVRVLTMVVRSDISMFDLMVAMTA
jgi:hypothetical protein